MFRDSDEVSARVVKQLKHISLLSQLRIDQPLLLFVVDILREEATLLVPNDLVRTLALKSFGATATGDTVVLPGIMSRKKQIIPNLAL